MWNVIEKSVTKRVFRVRLTRKGLARISLRTVYLPSFILLSFTSPCCPESVRIFSFTSFRPRTSFVHHNSMSFKKNEYDFSRGNIRIYSIGLEMSLVMRRNIMTIAAGIIALNIIYEGKFRMIHLTSNLALFQLVRLICTDFNGFTWHGGLLWKSRKQRK